MVVDTYFTIEEKSQGLYKEKGSKFISIAFPVSDTDEIREIIDDIKKEYFDARHHCYAYILGHDKSIFRMNDDGEPSFTGGKPIYGQLLSKDLTNVLVVVIRYFGGVKLGVGGLTQAYKQAALDALENARIIEKTIDKIYGVSFEYIQMNDVMRVMKENDLKQMNHRFDNNCYLEFKVRKSYSQAIVDRLDLIPGIRVDFLRLD